MISLFYGILFLINFFFSFSNLDVAHPYQIGFQDPASPTMEGIIKFHNDLMFLLILIVVFVLWIGVWSIVLFNEKKQPKAVQFVHGTTLEIVWTLIPAFALLLIAGPSFSLLYSMDEMINPFITLKVIGNQWYWSYEYNFNSQYSYEFDSYMLNLDDLELGNLRLLEVDNRVVLPTNTHIRVIVTSNDVLHSWAVPSLGVKLDACPGRLNQLSLLITWESVFMGQCSEICGVNHGFMPIVIDAVNPTLFQEWALQKAGSQNS